MLISMNGITKIYNEHKPNAVTALRGINLKIEQGKMYSIVGPSGSGKTTLLNIIGCIDTMTTGEYSFYGSKISTLSDTERAAIRNKNIGFVLQNFGLLNDRTVMENVSVPLYFSKIPYKKIQSRALEVITILKIDELQKRSVNQLSGGQRQRVAIARALVMNPSVILADEPTGSLDTNTAHEMMNIFCELNANNGTTVIIVTHNPEIAAYCNYQLTMVDGLLTA